MDGQAYVAERFDNALAKAAVDEEFGCCSGSRAIAADYRR
jgi:hypothetical protein